MKLSHFTSNAIETLEEKPPYDGNARSDRTYFKPYGLWVSVDGPDDWPSWCESENFRDINEQYHYSVELKSKNNVLVLPTAEDIKAFSKQYQLERIPGYDGYVPRMYLDWPRVAKDYQGIIIAPYQWGLRLDDEVSWYYGWDCASGCIWNNEAIEKIALIREPVKEKKQA